MPKNLPNYLTIVRIIFVPIIFSLILTEKYLIAFIFFTISSLTDIADGIIARKYNLITEWGKLMDPLADKLTQISTLTALSIKGIIPFWILLVVTIKEVSMICGAFFLYKERIVTVNSKWYGKAATVLFYVAIATSLIIRQFSLNLSFDIIIYYLALIMTVFSLIMYFRDFYIKGYFKKENLKLTQEAENKEK